MLFSRAAAKAITAASAEITVWVTCKHVGLYELSTDLLFLQ
jgi:hypothetical protein